MDAFQTSGTSPTVQTADFVLENHGSILFLKPQNPTAENWVNENIGENNGFQPLWPIVVVEPRYIGDIVDGVMCDGLAVTSGN